MGMFDTVLIPCTSCGKNVEMQTKDGECALREYTTEDIPWNLAYSLDGRSETCQHCGQYNTFKLKNRPQIDIE